MYAHTIENARDPLAAQLALIGQEQCGQIRATAICKGWSDPKLLHFSQPAAEVLLVRHAKNLRVSRVARPRSGGGGGNSMRHMRSDTGGGPKGLPLIGLSDPPFILLQHVSTMQPFQEVSCHWDCHDCMPQPTQ